MVIEMAIASLISHGDICVRMQLSDEANSLRVDSNVSDNIALWYNTLNL